MQRSKPIHNAHTSSVSAIAQSEPSVSKKDSRPVGHVF
jgi:hypothetical protein